MAFAIIVYMDKECCCWGRGRSLGGTAGSLDIDIPQSSIHLFAWLLVIANPKLKNPVFLFYSDLGCNMVFCVNVEPSPALAISKYLFDALESPGYKYS
jgi:hypothetical protein